MSNGLCPETKAIATSPMPRECNYTEEDMQRAQEARKGGTSLPEAQKTFGVPRETLRRRLKGAAPMRDAKEAYQRLSHSQEKRLCEWMCHVQKHLHARLTDKDIVKVASKILADDGDPDALKPFGKNWVKSFFYRIPEAKDVRANTKHLGPLFGQSFLYENETSFHWGKALHFQRELFELAKNDPRWTSVSKFDFPGAVRTYQTLRCAIMQFKLKESIWGGCFLRKAFLILPEELSEGGLNVVQDVCLNILGALTRYGFTEIGTRMLQHCSALNAINSERQLHREFFAALSQIIGHDQVQTDYYLWQLTGYYALELKQVRGSYHRSTAQAQRRHYLVVRDSASMIDIKKVKDLITSQQALLAAAVSELGKTHDKTLRIENETLRIQHYAHIYQDNYIAGIKASMSELERLYTFEQGQAAFGLWSKSHQSAYLRFLERMFDYYKYTVDVQEAIDTAQWIVAIEGYRTERWIVFLLEFEYWLQEIGWTGVSELYRQQRLNSGYYQNLEMEFCGEV